MRDGGGAAAAVRKKAAARAAAMVESRRVRQKNGPPKRARCESTVAASTAAPRQPATLQPVGAAVADVRVSLALGSLVIPPVGRAVFASPPVRCTLHVVPTPPPLRPLRPPTAAATATAHAAATLPIIYQCGTFGCTLPDNHAGLHRVSTCLGLTLSSTLTLDLTMTLPPP